MATTAATTPDPDSSPAAPSHKPGEDSSAQDDTVTGRRLRWLISLYALHGPPGTPSPHPALPTSWLTVPFVSARTAPFSVVLEPWQLPVLLGGFVPHRAAMCPWQDDLSGGGGGGGASEEVLPDADAPEHKWFVYATQEPGGRARIHIHRSWTGVKLIELILDTTAPDDDDDDGGGGGGAGHPPGGGRITQLAFEMHEDYKLKYGDERVYKYVTREVCWWVLGVCLGPEMEA